jgi:hypothetical protein
MTGNKAEKDKLWAEAKRQCRLSLITNHSRLPARPSLLLKPMHPLERLKRCRIGQIESQ